MKQLHSGFLAIAAFAGGLATAQTGDAAAACTEIQSLISSPGAVMTSSRK